MNISCSCWLQQNAKLRKTSCDRCLLMFTYLRAPCHQRHTHCPLDRCLSRSLSLPRHSFSPVFALSPSLSLSLKVLWDRNRKWSSFSALRKVEPATLPLPDLSHFLVGLQVSKQRPIRPPWGVSEPLWQVSWGRDGDFGERMRKMLRLLMKMMSEELDCV